MTSVRPRGVAPVVALLLGLALSKAIIEGLRGEFPDLAKVDVNASVVPSFLERLDASGFIDRLGGR